MYVGTFLLKLTGPLRETNYGHVMYTYHKSALMPDPAYEHLR